MFAQCRCLRQNNSSYESPWGFYKQRMRDRQDRESPGLRRAVYLLIAACCFTNELHLNDDAPCEANIITKALKSNFSASTMFAARANQENAIYEQQTAAAAKPLNQGVKGLAPKTPGNKAPKTPFKVSRNDENATFGVGKTGGKGKQDGLFEEGKGGRLDKAAFVTPAGLCNNMIERSWS